MKNIIIGTAGHIDHGKTTLIRALTGRNTDSLPEEIKRGITINLGFTYFDLPSGRRAGIVDVPGHERFIKNMIAGACGIDIVLLVIAATEGVKPQTIEHADIVSFLGIKDGLIVLTKCDMADDMIRELALDEIREHFKDTFFEDKEAVMVDSLSGYGLAELVKKIDNLTDRTVQRNTTAAPRLNIDRIFTKKGFGTIVTGTMAEGQISSGDELYIYHYGNDNITKTKIKNIQIHEENYPAAYAGQRTALNLSGVKATGIKRGDVLAAEGTVICTSVADAQLSSTKNTRVCLKMRDRLRVYLGSKETFARFVPFWEEGKDVLQPGESCFCQLRFEEGVYVKKGDPFVIRRYSPMETIGGGVILDPVPAKRRIANEDVLNDLAIKLQGSDADILEGALKNAGAAMTVKALSALVSKSEKQTEGSIKALLDENTAIAINDCYLHIDVLENFRMKLVETAAGYHNRFRLKPGIQKEELRSKTSLPLEPKEFDFLLELFCSDGTFKISENIVSLYGFEQKYTDAQQKTYDKIEKAYLKAMFTPPPKAQIVSDKASLEVFESMVKKVLVPLDDNNFIHIRNMDAAKEMIREHIAKHGGLTLAEFRDITKSSRKYCLLILEYLDNRGFTKREGESRVLC